MIFRKTLFLTGLCVIGACLFSACLKNTPQPSSPSPTSFTPTQLPTASPVPRDQAEEPISNINCTEYNPHPLGESIAEKFSADYEEVMDWYCDGYAFEDILLALQTSQLSGQPPQKILEDLDTLTWEEIWENLNLTAE